MVVATRGGQLLNYWGCAFFSLGMPNSPPKEKIWCAIILQHNKAGTINITDIIFDHF